MRHVDEHFDLDMTYITDRIIGKPGNDFYNKSAIMIVILATTDFLLC